jgi:hypothetical protein
MENDILMLVVISMLILGLVIVLVYAFNMKLIKTATLNDEKLKLISEQLRQELQPKVMDYYYEILFQSRWAFRFGLFGAVVGLAVIGVVVFVFIRLPGMQAEKQIAAICGGIVEAISILFLVGSRFAQANMEKYFRELSRKDILQGITDEKMKNDVSTLMLLGDSARHQASEAIANRVFKKLKKEWAGDEPHQTLKE